MGIPDDSIRSQNALENDYLHYSFSKGIADWIWRHNHYSTYEAEETIRSLGAGDFSASKLFSDERAVRRLALKKLSFRLPFRLILKFPYQYIFKFGILDGGAGLEHCALQATYEFFIVIKVKEIKRLEHGKLES